MMRQLKKIGAFLMAAALTLGLSVIPKQTAAGEFQPVKEQSKIMFGVGEDFPALKEHSMELRVGDSKKITLKNCKGLKVTCDCFQKGHGKGKERRQDINFHCR